MFGAARAHRAVSFFQPATHKQPGQYFGMVGPCYQARPCQKLQEEKKSPLLIRSTGPDRDRTEDRIYKFHGPRIGPVCPGPVQSNPVRGPVWVWTEYLSTLPTPAGFSNTSLNGLNTSQSNSNCYNCNPQVTIFSKTGYTTSKVSLDLDTLNPH